MSEEQKPVVRTELVVTRSFGYSCSVEGIGLQHVFLIPELAKAESAFLVACDGTVLVVTDTQQNRGAQQELIPPKVLRVPTGAKKVTVTTDNGADWTGMPTTAKGNGHAVTVQIEPRKFMAVGAVLPDRLPEHVQIVLDARELLNAQKDIGDGFLTLYVPTGPRTRGGVLPPVFIAGAYGCGMIAQSRDDRRVVDIEQMFSRIKVAHEQTRK